MTDKDVLTYAIISSLLKIQKVIMIIGVGQVGPGGRVKFDPIHIQPYFKLHNYKYFCLNSFIQLKYMV